MTVEEAAEVERQVMEIERSNRYEDVDEDDAGDDRFFAKKTCKVELVILRCQTSIRIQC